MASLLDEVNAWCVAHGVRPFSEANLGRPDGKGARIVRFFPEQSFVNRGFIGNLVFEYQSGNRRYKRPIRVNSWKEGITPAIVDGVMVVVLARVAGEFYSLVAENYRANVCEFGLECARGFASDVDWQGEASGYSEVMLPKHIWDPEVPEDGVICLKAARQELEQEIIGSAKLSHLWYTGYMFETDSTGRMHTGLWLATVELESLSAFKPGEPDSLQRDSFAIPLSEIQNPLCGRIKSAQVIAAHHQALCVLEKVRQTSRSIDALWSGSF